MSPVELTLRLFGAAVIAVADASEDERFGFSAIEHQNAVLFIRRAANGDAEMAAILSEGVEPE